MNWKLVRQIIGDPAVDDWSDADREEELAWGYTKKIVEEDLTLGFSLLRAYAEAGAEIVEIGPGVWRDSGDGITWYPKQFPAHDPGE